MKKIKIKGRLLKLMSKIKMRKAARINIIIGRFGEEPKKLEVGKGATVADALKQAGITLSTGETPWVDGETATQQDILEDKDVLNIVGRKEGGKQSF